MNSNQASGVTLSVLKELQEKFSVSASKALGQNFLIDPNISRKIAQICGDPKCVIEVGPGIGSLTVALAQTIDQVVAIEYDKYILDPLSEILNQFQVAQNVTVINEDVMKVDLESLCKEYDTSVIAGNLPYNISASLLADIAHLVPSAKFVVAMVQKEVGERLAATQKTRGVSSITLKCQLFMDIEIQFGVARQSFVPAPRVDSVVITMKRKEELDQGIEPIQVKDLFLIIDCAFSQRRKMMRQSLKSLFGKDLENIFVKANVESTLRPEQCDLKDFAAILRSWKNDNV